MNCPHSATPNPYQLGQKTTPAYRTFRCRGCRRTYNEWTGTPYNHLEWQGQQEVVCR
jgi:transposase-like protein